MAIVDVYFSLGSNMGCREKNLEAALEMMSDVFDTQPADVSKSIETESWGFQGADFLNSCALFSLERSSAMTAQEHAQWILEQVKGIERRLGREEMEITLGAHGKRVYSNRPIDIDILFYGTEKINTETLTIPHPLIARRDFVKVPLREIARGELRETYGEIFEN